jgi:arylsulfatase A-like enzyme
MEDDFPTLAEVLNDHGYITAGFSNNGWVETEKTRVARGFAEYTLARLAKPIEPFLPETDPDKQDKGSWVTVGLVREWLDRHAEADAPFLLFINCVEPHMRYWPPQSFRSQFLLEGVDQEYARQIPQLQFQGTTGQVVLSPEDWEIVKSLRDGETACLDHRIGLILTYMRQKGILDSTVVFILGDHGDSTGEHGTHTGHCQTGIWDTVLHTPLVVRGPSFPRGQRVQHLVQTTDILPTILPIAGIDDPAVRQEIQGTSLLAALGDEPPREFAVAEVQKPLEPLAFMRQVDPKFDSRIYNRLYKCARTREYKYVWASDGRDELYDIAKDKDEQQNIIKRRPEIALELRSKLRDFLVRLDR